VSDVLLLDVTPLSVGLETIGGVMKKLIPRNTTIPVRRSDIFSTSENNQSQVEIHVVQGEREMAADNKSLGRFMLSGIPPAPRGIPQVQVSFDVDANGILQVSALDRSTGREQSVTIQGASTLTEREIGQAIQQAEEFAEIDRLRREKIDRRNRAEALATRAERELRSVALDFGLQFAQGQRRRIDILVQELRDSLSRNDERGIDLNSASLQDAMYELNREVSEFLGNEEGEGILNTIRRTFAGDDDPNFGLEERSPRLGRPSFNESPYDDRAYDRPARPARRPGGGDRPGGRPPSRVPRTNAYDEDWGDEDDWF
jgi:molecular chaperone DnaK